MLSQSFQLPEKQRRGRSRTYVHHARLHVSKNDGIFNVVEVRMVGFKKQQRCILICLCIDKPAEGHKLVVNYKWIKHSQVKRVCISSNLDDTGTGQSQTVLVRHHLPERMFSLGYNLVMRIQRTSM